MDTTTKIEPVTLKAASKKVFHKSAEGAGEFIGNKIAYKFVKPKSIRWKF